MEKELLQLVDVVRREVDLYSALLKLLERKSDVIVDGNLDAILRSIKEEEKLASKIRSLEASLQQLSRVISEKLGIPYAEFNLMKLARELGPPLSGQLFSLCDDFRELVGKIKRVNKRNLILLNNYLSCTNLAAQIFYQAASCYQSSGVFQPPQITASYVSSHA